MAKKAKRRETDGELNITSMMDMMTIILCFLLKSMSATEITVTPSDNLKLPISSSLQDPAIAVSVVVAKDRILVADKPILNLTSFADENNPGEVLVGIAKSDRQGMAIPALHEAFTEQAKAAKKFGSIREDMEFKGRIFL
jgi:biopolymer transport protein ExbD